MNIGTRRRREPRAFCMSSIRSCTVVALRGNAVCWSKLLRVMRSDDDDDARKCASACLLKRVEGSGSVPKFPLAISVGFVLEQR